MIPSQRIREEGASAPSNPSRRFLIGALVALPVAGPIISLARKRGPRASDEAAQAPTRGFIDPLDERQLPIVEKALPAAQEVSEERDR